MGLTNQFIERDGQFLFRSRGRFMAHAIDYRENNTRTFSLIHEGAYRLARFSVNSSWYLYATSAGSHVPRLTRGQRVGDAVCSECIIGDEQNRVYRQTAVAGGIMMCARGSLRSRLIRRGRGESGVGNLYFVPCRYLITKSVEDWALYNRGSSVHLEHLPPKLGLHSERRSTCPRPRPTVTYFG